MEVGAAKPTNYTKGIAPTYCSTRLRKSCRRADVVCRLVYPCSGDNPITVRGAPVPSELPNRGRRVRVWLTAMPMCVAAERVASPFQNQLRSIQSQ